MFFKVRTSDNYNKDMSETELRKIIGEFMLDQAKRTGNLKVPVVNNGRTVFFYIEAIKAN